ncbi:threonine 3-dehydrogenase, NAD(P)-binding [Desulfamplus magnetovallimortis]|uniref:L-threonine 3-dehydrogenase n=1 Tax=Desulfamplus magnetovallimortis TaxID=1246637 RepID=A0A1W1HIW5_9BACT|nr:L-threonine 3-dehydrogenase [Desulfamplus magnetovallimortis]SLM32383.1 threonine 3-dehydrogenase, NAD(P)-binding [Desulfamplus magnetovallimortis]
MKALVKAKPEPGLWLQDVPEPKYGPADVLIKIRKTAICGTDLHIYNWDAWSQKTIKTPMVIGHEFVGEVVAVGAAVKNFRPGQRVSGEGHLTCGKCRSCRAGKRHLCIDTHGVGVNRIGCFTELLVIPEINVYPVPDNLEDDIAAIMDPFGNAAHTALSFDLVGEDVIITGAGPIGIMAATIAKRIGARHVVITDVNDYRLNLAKSLASVRAVNVARESLSDIQNELGMMQGFDVGMEMSGVPSAFDQMLESMNHGGKIAMLGIFSQKPLLNSDLVIFKSLTLKGIYGREMFETWYKMISLVQSGLDIAPIITHRFDVDDFQKGFDVMNSGQSGKVILNWGE